MTWDREAFIDAVIIKGDCKPGYAQEFAVALEARLTNSQLGSIKRFRMKKAPHDHRFYITWEPRIGKITTIEFEFSRSDGFIKMLGQIN